ncbi:MAG: ribonuclease P protein component [Candidatus Pacebacteria bacterium]|nr:ribonuclease P protein component [Candidatus Paceibacterota bacterium]
MFKKTERLNRSEFSKCFKSGHKSNFKHLTIVTADHPSLKAVVVVGKKVAKSAVKRNKIRRRIYASLYNQLVNKNHKGVLIVIVKPTYTSLTRKVADEFLIGSIAQVLKDE